MPGAQGLYEVSRGKKCALGISRTAPWRRTLVLSRPGEGAIAEV
jgi:hypothetical protein